jgi:hypothetical protein
MKKPSKMKRNEFLTKTLNPDLEPRLYPRHIEAYEFGMMSPTPDMIVSSGRDYMTYHFLSEIIIGEVKGIKTGERKSTTVRRSLKIRNTGIRNILEDIDKERRFFFIDCEEQLKKGTYNIDALK